MIVTGCHAGCLVKLEGIDCICLSESCSTLHVGTPLAFTSWKKDVDTTGEFKNQKYQLSLSALRNQLRQEMCRGLMAMSLDLLTVAVLDQVIS